MKICNSGGHASKPWSIPCQKCPISAMVQRVTEEVNAWVGSNPASDSLNDKVLELTRGF